MNNKFLLAAIAIIVILQVVILLQLGKGGKLSGTTADDWNVGGALTVTGASTLTGNTTLSGTLTATGGASTLATTTAGRLVQGGQVWTTSTGSTGTSTADIVANYSVWEVTPLREGTTLNLPSTTTLYSYLNTNGQFIEFSIHNATTNAAGTLTIAKGLSLGLDLRATSTDELTIGAQNWATVKIYRDSITTSTVFVIEYPNLAD